MNPTVEYKDFLYKLFESPNNTLIPLSFADGGRWSAVAAMKISINNDGIYAYKLVKYRKLNDKSKYTEYTGDLTLKKKSDHKYKFKGYTLSDGRPISLTYKTDKYGCITIKWHRKGYASTIMYVLDRDIMGLFNL